MASNETSEPDETIDTTTPHAARVYDYVIGGTANFEVDRAAAAQAASLYPGGLEAVMAASRANRAFLGRAVRWLAGEAGIRQFLDLGTGIPDETNVHAIAQATAPSSRVVGVDYDNVVLAHAHQMVRSTPEGAAEFIRGDFREPEPILERAAETLDFKQPIAVLLAAILHLIEDAEDPKGLVGRLMAAVPSGSYLVLSHVTNDLEVDIAEAAQRLTEMMAEPMVVRSKAELAAFLEGLELVEPGIVAVDRWRPDSDEAPGEYTMHHAVVARKP